MVSGDTREALPNDRTFKNSSDNVSVGTPVEGNANTIHIKAQLITRFRAELIHPISVAGSVDYLNFRTRL